MSDRVVQIAAKWSRRMQDPNFPGAETHFMLVPASELPDGLPLNANPREPQINRPVYRTVSRSLRQDDDSIPGSFHLKHRGLTLVASAVKKSRELHPAGLDVFELHFADDGMYGIVDGGHSYEIVQEANKSNAIPKNAFIKLEVMTGLDTESLVTEIAGGRNTSMQVQDKSLADLEGKFQFLKDELEVDGWVERVAWHEGDDGDIDVVDVIAAISCFDIESHPDRSSHPVDAYRRKKSMLDRFRSDPHRYHRLTPVIRDILQLHDWIAYDSENRWQEIGGVSGSGGKYGHLDMVEKVKEGRSGFEFPFLPDMRSQKRLRRPATFPILASFRLLLVQDKTAESVGRYRPVMWRNDFDEVMELWEAAGGQLLRTFYEHWDTTGRDLHAAGRSPALWGSVYKELAVIDAERRGAI